MKILLLIDVQEGFLNESTQQIPGDIMRHIKSNAYDLVIATRFINKPGSLYQSELNMKDMTMVSNKSKLVEGMGDCADIVLMKSTYSSFTEDVSKLLEKYQMKEVYIAGLNTHNSILATVFNLFDRGIRPIVIENLCGSKLGKRTNDEVLDILRATIGQKNIQKIY